jgi:[ribosomal protein S5]-alanine N-acetyltransferase
MDNIKTERLELQLLKQEFAAALLPNWNDEEVVRYTYINNVNNIDSCEKRIASMIENNVSRNAVGPYAIFREDKLIGIVAAYRHSSFEYGLFYHLGKVYWGYGYATEAVKAIVDVVFMKPEIVRISAEAVTANIASSRVLEKIGMTLEGCLRKKFSRDDIYYDLYAYSILRDEYLTH